MGKLQQLIEDGILVKDYDDEDSVTYAAENAHIKYNGETVLNIILCENGVVWVMTQQGREHVGEFEFSINDDIDLEVFTK